MSAIVSPLKVVFIEDMLLNRCFLEPVNIISSFFQLVVIYNLLPISYLYVLWSVALIYSILK